MKISGFSHNDIGASSVLGEDSLLLMKLCPELKPAIVLTIEQHRAIESDIPEGCMSIFLENKVYVVNGSYYDFEQAIREIEAGDDSALLGYPIDRDGITVIVTRDGRVESNMNAIMEAKAEKNIIWAAEGKGVRGYAEKIAGAVKGALCRTI